MNNAILEKRLARRKKGMEAPSIDAENRVALATSKGKKYGNTSVTISG